jgi:hypothetical protein
MDPITWATALGVLRKYWWVGILVILSAYILILRSDVKSKSKTIEDLLIANTTLQGELNSFKLKLDVQNRAIEELNQKGKEQALRLEVAITKVNAMKPATQVIIREIYSDKTKDIDQLLLNAITD